jgi:protein tyrosine/serine phosphatase
MANVEDFGMMASMETIAPKPKRRRLRLAIVLVLALGGLGIGGYYYKTYAIDSNFAVVIPGKVYRSGQPRLDQLKSWVDEFHIRTIVNLRGNNLDECKKEATQAAKMNVADIPIALSAKRPVTKAELAQIIKALDESQTPILLHCRAGNDRSGLVSMLAVLAMGQTDYATARKQLRTPWYGRHISETIVMYEQYCTDKTLAPNSWPQFKKWAAEVYNPAVKETQGPQGAE